MVEVADFDDYTKKIDNETCVYCVGTSTIWSKRFGRYLTSKEWCEEFDTCAATIDWEKVFDRNK